MNECKKVNFHTHTDFCDGKASAEEMVLSAISKGIEVLGFSSHCIHPLNPDFYRTPDDDWHIPSEKVNDYAVEINSLKQKYSDKIKILLGFEADYFNHPQIGKAVPSKNAYSIFKPDFLLGSVHFVCTEKGFYTVDNTTEIIRDDLIRLYTDSKTGKIDNKAAVCDYFAAQREMLKNGDFDIWGHPDLIRKRNGALKFFDENDSWYKDELIATAKIAAGAGVIAEINTGAIYRKAMDDCYPSLQFLQILHDYKIPVCINSDAHNPDAIDFAFDRAIIQAKKTGYTELIYPGNYIIKL